jgi:hypothetical protein
MWEKRISQLPIHGLEIICLREIGKRVDFFPISVCDLRVE